MRADGQSDQSAVENRQRLESQRGELPRGISPRVVGSLAFSYLAAVILACAAALKIHHLSQSPPEVGAFGINTRVLAFLLIQGELILAFLLIAGWKPVWTWRLSFAAFCAFSGAVIVKLINGDVSCGCFGALEVSPWVALGVDALFVLGFAVLPPVRVAAPAGAGLTPRAVATGVAYCSAVLVASYVLAFQAPAVVDARGNIVGEGNVVHFRPDHWQGRELPIARFIASDVDLSRGAWRLVFVRPNCSRCHAVLPQVEELALRVHEANLLGGRNASLQGTAPLQGIVVVEIPPFGQGSMLDDETKCHYARLSDEYDWRISTPAQVELRDGVVTRIPQGVGDE